MGKRYDLITYSQHAEQEIRRRKLERTLIEAALQNPGIIYPAKEAPKLVAEALNPSGSVMKVVFVEYSAKHAHVVTAHKLRPERSRL